MAIHLEAVERRMLLAVTPAPDTEVVAVDDFNAKIVLATPSTNPIAFDAQVHHPANASFSPDRTKILFDGHNTGVDNSYAICTINVDGTDLQVLPGSGTDQDAHFSPDGSRIVFISKRDGNAEVYVMNADGSTQTRF